MGGSSSTPDSPNISSDRRLSEKVKDKPTRRGSCSPSAGTFSRRSPSPQNRGSRGCRSDVSEDEESEEEEDDDESDYCDEDEDDDDEEDDECDEDDEEEEDCEDDDDDDEEEDDECEEEDDKRAFTPCREPEIERKPRRSESQERASAFTPCRESSTERKPRRSESQERASAFTPCRESSSKRKHRRSESQERASASKPCRESSTEKKTRKREKSQRSLVIKPEEDASAFKPCREPSVETRNKKSEPEERALVFTPCREPQASRSSERSDSEERHSRRSPVYDPCRDPPRKSRSSGNKKSRPRRERRNSRNDTDSEYAQEDERTDSPPPPCKEPPKLQQPCKRPSQKSSAESAKEPSKKQGFCPFSAITRVFFPQQESPAVESPPPGSGSCLTKRKSGSPVRQHRKSKDEAEPRAIWTKQQECIQAKESKSSQESLSEEKPPGEGLRCIKSPPKADEAGRQSPCKSRKSKKPKPEDELINGESLLDLHKGCAYLSKKEIRKVSTKYRSYGYVKDQEVDFLPGQSPKPRKINAEVYSVGYLDAIEGPGRSSEYSGSLGPACNVNNTIIPLGESGSVQGEKSQRNMPEGKYTSPSRRVKKDRWRSRSNSPREFQIFTNTPSPADGTSPDRQCLEAHYSELGQEDDRKSSAKTTEKYKPPSGPAKKDRRQSRTKSPTKIKACRRTPSPKESIHEGDEVYDSLENVNANNTGVVNLLPRVHEAIFSSDQLKPSSKDLGNIDILSNIPKSISSAKKNNFDLKNFSNVGLFPNFPRSGSNSGENNQDMISVYDHENKSNSNNTCLVDQTDSTPSDCGGENETTSSNTSTQHVIDDLWFECLETDTVCDQCEDIEAGLDFVCFNESRVLGLGFPPLSTPNSESDSNLSYDDKTDCDLEVSSLTEQRDFRGIIDFLDWLPSGSSFPQCDDLDSALPVSPMVPHDWKQTSKARFLTTNEFDTASCHSSARQTASETNLRGLVKYSRCLQNSSNDFHYKPRRHKAIPHHQDINTNADSLLRYKKSLSHQKLQSKSTSDRTLDEVLIKDSDLDTLRTFAKAQGCPVFDLGLAHDMGISNEEIKELLMSLFSSPEERADKLEQLNDGLFDVDLARDMGLTRSQVKVLLETPSQLAQSESAVFDVDAAMQMGLSPAETEKLTSSSSPLNNAKYMLMMGEAPFDPGLALSMGLAPEQVSRLSDSSLLISRATIGKMDLEKKGKLPTAQTQTEILFDPGLAKAVGLTGSQIRRLASSSSQSSKTGLATFNRQTAKTIGLSEDQINLLAKSSLTLAPQEQTKRPVFLDEQMAQKMGLTEGQVKQLAYNSTNRMLGQRMFDPYLALQIGMPMQQIKKLATTIAQKKSKVALNEALARSMGLSEAQISLLKESSPRVKQADLESAGLTDQKVFDVAMAVSLGLHTREINQLLATSATGSTIQIPPRQNLQVAKPRSKQPEPPRSKPLESDPPSRTVVMKKPTRFPFDFSAVGDGSARKAALRKRILMSRLQESISDGDKVSDVLNTLVEWNSILLVVIFLLLLGTSCPNVMKNVLPCPIPSACQTFNAYVIVPLGLDGAWQKLAVGRNQTYAAQPTKGAAYTFVSHLVAVLSAGVSSAWRYVFLNLLVPFATLPGTVGVPLLKLLLSALYCTVHTTIYWVYYGCAMFLGLSVPTSLQALQQDSYRSLAHVTAKPLAQAKPKEAAQKMPPDSTETKEGQGQLQPFNPAQAEPMAPDLHTLQQYGGFLFYVGFDPPKKGCNYSTLSSLFLWLAQSLPEECA